MIPSLVTIPAEHVTASTQRRTITGLVVPWDRVGHSSVGPVSFSRGSLTPPEPLDRLKLLAGHRLAGHPDPDVVGHATSLMESPDGLEVVFSVSSGTAGDEALLSASEGMRDGLSVEVDSLDGRRDRDGIYRASAGSLRAVATVAVPAFQDARVLAVVASTPPPETDQETPPMTEQTTPDQSETVEAVEATAEVASSTPAPDVAASRPTSGSSIPAAPRSNGQELTLARVSGMIASANRGELPAGTLQAALSTTGDLAGLVPPAYVSELAGLVNVGRPLVGATRTRPLPSTGMAVTYPAWTALPTVAGQSTEGTAVSSTKATIEMRTTPVVTEAGANDLSFQSVDRSDPAAVEALLGALAEMYARQTDTNMMTELLAVASAVPTQGLNAAEVVAGLMGALSPLETPAGGLYLAVSWDQYVELFVGLADADKPAWWNGTVQMGGPTEVSGSAGGISVVVDPLFPAGTQLLGARNGASYWENPGAPVNVRAVNVDILTLSVGVYGYHAITVEYEGAFAKGNTAAAPVATRAKAK